MGANVLINFPALATELQKLLQLTTIRISYLVLKSRVQRHWPITTVEIAK